MRIDWQAKGLKFWRDFARPVLVILIVVCSFRSAVADWNGVPTGSMKPAILEGDRIFVNKLAYDLRVPFTDWRIMEWSGPARGDVVVFFSPDDEVRLVKRVVGLPGDTIEMRRNRLLINGEPVKYGPLDQATINQIETDQQPRYHFATESFGDHAHPIMTTPLHSSRHSFLPVTAGANQYFMMGDNRDLSRDSRWFGFVHSRRIVGRAVGVAISFDPDRYYLPRWHRFFSAIP